MAATAAGGLRTVPSTVGAPVRTVPHTMTTRVSPRHSVGRAATRPPVTLPIP